MKKPHIIVNCAMSADGKIALPSRESLRISCEEDIKRVHKLRNECDAVLVGIGTIITDDPHLTVKYIKNPRHPMRVVLDTRCRIPPTARVLNDLSKTIIISKEGYERDFNKSNVEVYSCKVDKEGYIDLKEALHLLYCKGVRKLLVEGGGTVIWNFLKSRLVDDLYIYISPSIIGGKNTPTPANGTGIKNKKDLISLKIIGIKRVGEGVLIHYRMVK
jgi:2,5-diamino-6-(ribosylamino)-4(3H)-pyrimidinone 5'-phosphate reductase